VKSTPLSNLRTAFAGKQSAKGALQAVALRLRTSASGTAFSFDGLGETSIALDDATTPTVSAPHTSPRILEALPGDVVATHSGSNFATDINKWQDSGGPLPTSILAQPRVSQLLKALTVPYGWYTRTGADTNPDTGLIIDLSTLTTPLQLGDASIEQGLAALVPVVMEQPLTTSVAFKDGNYAGVPLRFVNILGSTITLDYTIFNNYLLISSSKEGMLALVDTISKKNPSVLTSNEWQPFFTEWGTVPEARDIIFGSFNQAMIQKLLPLSSADQPFKLGMSLQLVNGSPELHGFLMPPLTSPSSSPLPTP